MKTGILRAVLIAFVGMGFAFVPGMVLHPHPAAAQAYNFSTLPPLPAYPMTEADFEAQTNQFQETPYGDKHLSYSMRLPKGWSKLKMDGSQGMVDTSKDLLGLVGKFYGPPSIIARSSVIIKATELQHEITVKNWFLNYVLTNGYTLQGMKSVSKTRMEALYVLLDNGVSYVVRAVAEINGSRIVLVTYSIPENEWKKEQALQAKCIESFRFLSPEKANVETTRTYSFLDLLRFDYPVSWRLQAPNILSIESMSARLISAKGNDVLNGQIDVHVISTELDTTLAAEIKNVQKDLAARGLVIGKLIAQPKDFDFHKQIYFSRVEIYQANSKDHDLVDYEYWIAVMIENRYYYIVTMLTPSRTTDFYTWARNSEAFRTVVESMRL